MIALIADIHSNLTAMKAVLTDAKKRKGKKVEKIYCVGDVVGYAAKPNECCELIKKEKIPCILGNHDLNAVTLERIDWFNPVAAAALRWTHLTLSRENRRWLTSLPRKLTFKADRKRICMIHGSPRDPIYEYVLPDVTDITLRHFLDTAKTDILVLAHTHMPFVRKVDGRLVINPGSVGQPRDGDARASYALVDPEAAKATIERVTYDIDKTAREIEKARLPYLLASRLYSGS